MVTAFISYARDDTDFLENSLLPLLQELGVAARYDKDVRVSEFWLTQVQGQLEHSDWLMVVLSASYQEKIRLKAGPCFSELECIANRWATALPRPRVVTLRLAGNIPDLIKTCQAIDLRTNLDPLRTELSRLLEATSDQSPIESPDLPDEILRPDVTDPSRLPALARFNFDHQALDYCSYVRTGTTTAMQLTNALNLLSLLSQALPKKLKSWIDAGCGTGLMCQAIWQHAGFSEYRKCCDILIKSSIRAAFDYAPRMVAIAKRDHFPHYTHCFEADLVTLNKNRLNREVGVEEVDLVLANNVVHWLFFPKEIDKAFANAQEALRSGGLLAVSIAAVGTANLFLQAYRKEMEDAFMNLLPPKEAENWKDHLSNPIGLQSLHDIVRIARKNRFKILTAKLTYEPIRYAKTSDYVSVARAYGEQVFMAPLLKWAEDSSRQEIWQRIEANFTRIHEEQFRGSEYEHDQFMIYLVAQCE